MPGAPWSSTGCSNCRKRKIKCDMLEPDCERCMKRGIKCSGYEKFRILFHQDSKDTPRTVQGPNSNRKAHYVSRARPISRGRSLVDPTMNREQIFGEYMNTFFPTRLAGSTRTDPYYYVISILGSLPNKSPILQSAITAASCVFVAKLRSDNGLLHEGLRFYNIAIRYMSDMIGKSIYCDDLVYTATIFLMIEECHCPGGIQTWLVHSAGLYALLKQCYPRMKSKSLVETIFKYSQLCETLPSTIAFESGEYVIQMQKPHEDPLGELIYSYSRLSHVFKKFPRLRCLDLKTCQALHHECLLNREKIKQWYINRIEKAGALPFQATEELCPKLSSGRDLFGTSYGFISLDNARLHLNYWTILGMVEYIIVQISLQIRSYAPQCATEYPGDYPPLTFYADEIARAAPYCLQNNMRMWGAKSFLWFAGHICKTYIDARCLEKFEWCQIVFRRMASFGLEGAARIGDLFADLALKDHQRLGSSSRDLEPTETPLSWWEYVKKSALMTDT